MADRAKTAAFEYLDTVPAVEKLTGEIATVTELALDTEGASFHRFVDRIYLLQLSTRGRHAVIDPLAVGTPAGLGKLLENPNVEVVFHDADYDLRLLQRDYGWQIKNIFDTRVAAQLLGYTAFGLAALLERFFDVKLDKKHQRADWSMRPLTADMLDYAAQDTRFLLELKDKMSAELERMGRMPWAREEFGLLEGTRWADEDPGMSFLKLKGARDLSRRELAVLRELGVTRISMGVQSFQPALLAAHAEHLDAVDARRVTPGEQPPPFTRALGRRLRLVNCAAQDDFELGRDAGHDSAAGQDSLSSRHQRVGAPLAVDAPAPEARSAASCASSQRSASIAARQPSPAAVTACR